VYARLVEPDARARAGRPSTFGPASLAIGLAFVAALAPSCRGGTGEEQAAELCEDLGHLEATIAELAAPRPGTTVGEIRGALDRLDPTFEAVQDSDLVSERTAGELRDAQSVYRDQIGGIGDDHPLAGEGLELAGSQRRIAESFEVAESELGCGSITPSP
jgi:hypothetical protein